VPVLPFGEFRPDVSDYQGAHSGRIDNVLPRGDGYGPFPDFTAFTTALPAACRGFFVARNADASVTIFAGTATRLYRLNNTDFTFTDVSKGGAAYPGLSAADQWQFAQFNSLVVAVQANAPPQVYDLTSSTAFADLGGSPPQARYVAVVGRFLVLSGLLSQPYRIQWSGLNALTTWTAGVNQSDFQDLPDGGTVRGVAGGEFGVIFQDASIRRMTYAPGSPVIFQIDRIAEDKGLYAPLSLIRAGDRILFLSPQGFNMMQSGGLPVPVGKERVDRTFFADVDSASLQLIIGAADPRGSRVFWAYKSLAGTTGLFDRMLCYDWALDRWTRIAMMGEFLATLSKPGLTLENLDTISSSIETLPFSLDDVTGAAFPQIAGVNGAHRLGFFTGAALEAVLETAEQGGDGRRIFVRGFRPLTDAASCTGVVSARENLQVARVFGAESPVNAQGLVPARVSTRYARGRVRIPAGTAWSFAMGVEPDVVTEGSR
jgi:hypothetical protein